MAEPLLAVLLLRQLGFPPWQYGLAFAAPASAGSSAHAWPAASWGTTAGHEHTPSERLARTLSAWSIGSGAAIAIFNALGGLLADATGPRTALAIAGLLILASPLPLPRRRDSPLTRPATLGLRSPGAAYRGG